MPSGNFEIPALRLKGGYSASELRRQEDWCPKRESNSHVIADTSS